MYWLNNVEDEVKPRIGQNVLCFCPDWCNSAYQVANWNGKRFEYDEMPNDMFDGLVVGWAAFMEAN